MRNDDEAILVVAGACILLFVGGMAFMIWPYPLDARLTEKTWARTIEVERWQENQHEGWDVPSGGVVVSSERRKKSENRYKCGTDLNGNDRYCTSNVYDDWYVYRIWEWTFNRRFEATGSYQTAPAWPETPGVRDSDPLNPERLGKRHEIYHVVFVAKGGRVLQSDISRAEWDRLNEEQTYTVKTNNASMVVEIKEK